MKLKDIKLYEGYKKYLRDHDFDNLSEAQQEDEIEQLLLVTKFNRLFSEWYKEKQG